uniref:NB-ARC domain-containing protein n=1 Tax=Manihot esculenta TaxID=3983 RepID=A0A2C9V576_MANES
MNNLMRDSSMAGNRNMIKVDEKTHHLSLGFHFDPSDCGIPSAKQLRTFLLPCQEVWPSSEGRKKMPNNETLFSNFRNLRVFDLHNSGIEKVPTCIQKMKYLRYLDLSRNDKIKALPNSISRLQLLQELYILDCPHLKSWWKKGDDLTMKITAELPHFTRLSKLEISECPQLTCMPLFPNLDEKLLLENCSLVQHLQQMIKMSIVQAVPSTSSSIVQAVPSTSSSSSSSSSMLGLSKLKALWVVSIEDLKAFPQELLLILTSLEELHLKDCPRLASLPLEMRQQLTLRALDIKGCSQLKEKYGTRKCSDWRIISHIPNIQIDGQKVQWDRKYLGDQEDSSIVPASPLSKLKTLIIEDLESLPEDWLPNLTRLQHRIQST